MHQSFMQKHIGYECPSVLEGKDSISRKGKPIIQRMTVSCKPDCLVSNIYNKKNYDIDENDPHQSIPALGENIFEVVSDRHMQIYSKHFLVIFNFVIQLF